MNFYGSKKRIGKKIGKMNKNFIHFLLVWVKVNSNINVNPNSI
jgi:hypothetical protein